jgi:hypothetical protein
MKSQTALFVGATLLGIAWTLEIHSIVPLIGCLGVAFLIVALIAAMKSVLGPTE